MGTEIQRRLEARYGTNDFYEFLSPDQTAFLLDPRIANNTGTCGDKSVSIKGIHSDPDVGTLVDLLDVHHYLFRRNDRGGKGGYTHSRVETYQSVLGVDKSERPLELEDGTFLFDLDNGNSIRVEYDSVKDRA